MLTGKANDWVLLKIQPYRQSTLQHRRNEKLSPKFFEPYRVVERVGSVAYKLELPPSATIHPIFHISQLKKGTASGGTTSNSSFI